MRGVTVGGERVERAVKGWCVVNVLRIDESFKPIAKWNLEVCFSIFLLEFDDTTKCIVVC